MEIQNISGTDMISRGLNVNSNISNENAKIQKQEVNEDLTNPEKNKGNIIDTKA